MIAAVASAAPGIVWAYCIVFFLVQDVGKVLFYKFMTSFNLCSINRTTSHVQDYDADHWLDSRHPLKKAKGLVGAFSR
jgi:hypothetical protein